MFPLFRDRCSVLAADSYPWRSIACIDDSHVHIRRLHVYPKPNMFIQEEYVPLREIKMLLRDYRFRYTLFLSQIVVMVFWRVEQKSCSSTAVQGREGKTASEPLFIFAVEYFVKVASVQQLVFSSPPAPGSCAVAKQRKGKVALDNFFQSCRKHWLQRLLQGFFFFLSSPPLFVTLKFSTVRVTHQFRCRPTEPAFAFCQLHWMTSKEK